MDEPEFMGTDEVCHELKVSPGNLGEVARLPPPYQVLAGGRLWDAEVIRRFAREREEWKPLVVSRYRHDSGHPSRLNKMGRAEPTRQPRHANRLYALIWPDHDLFKLGLGSGNSARDASALQSIRKYLSHEKVVPGPFEEWRAELPALEGSAWGDCQRLEMVFATAAKRRLEAASADAVGLEWLSRKDLDRIDWNAELTGAAIEALAFSGLDTSVTWLKCAGRSAGALEGSQHRRGRARALDAHRTMRNKRNECALKGCGAPLPPAPVLSGRFRYCSRPHAKLDAEETSVARATWFHPTSCMWVDDSGARQARGMNAGEWSAIGARLLGPRTVAAPARRRKNEPYGRPSEVQHIEFAFEQWPPPYGKWRESLGKYGGQVHSLDGSEPLRSCNEVEVAKRLRTVREHAFWFSAYKSPELMPAIWHPWVHRLGAPPAWLVALDPVKPVWLAALDAAIRLHIRSASGGIPDVVAWNADDPLASAIFVECKSPADRFSEAQEDWVWAARQEEIDLSQIAVSVRPA